MLWSLNSLLGWFNSRVNASERDHFSVNCEMHSFSFFPLLSPKGALTECYDELGNRYQLPVYCLAPPINMIEEKGDLETLDIPDPPPNSGHECQLRLRLSTGKDLKLMVRSMDTVYHMKRRLHAVEGVEPGSQRWFFSGRPLADKMKLEELKIPKDYVVQVIVSQPLANPTPVENWFLLVYWFFFPPSLSWGLFSLPSLLLGCPANGLVPRNDQQKFHLWWRSAKTKHKNVNWPLGFAWSRI